MRRILDKLDRLGGRAPKTAFHPHLVAEAARCGYLVVEGGHVQLTDLGAAQLGTLETVDA